MKAPRFIAIAAVFALAVASATPSDAALINTIYTTGFAGGPGGLPTDWAADHIVDTTKVRLNGQGQLQDAASNSDVNRLHYNGTGALAWDDYTVTATWRCSDGTINSYAGVTGRRSSSGNYYAVIFYDQDVILRKYVNGVVTNLGSTKVTWSPRDNTWRTFALNFDGSIITANVFDLNGISLLSSPLTATDSAHTTGTAGIWIRASSTGLLQFDDFTVAVVPEPATLAFLAIGGLGMAGATIRRRRRSA